jgi:hypothetical protein
VAAQPAHAVGLARGGPEQPGLQPLGLPDQGQVLRQQQPGDLADVAGVLRVQAVRAGDRPDRPTVAVDEVVPGHPIAVAGPCNQLGGLHRRRRSFVQNRRLHR